MNKDDILAMSRAENHGTDEYERHVLEKAGKLAAQAGLMVCCMIAVVSVIVTEHPNNACWVIYFSIHATLFWTKYHCLRKRHELVMAVISTLAVLMFLVLFVLEMVWWRNG